MSKPHFLKNIVRLSITSLQKQNSLFEHIFYPFFIFLFRLQQTHLQRCVTQTGISVVFQFSFYVYMVDRVTLPIYHPPSSMYQILCTAEYLFSDAQKYEKQLFIQEYNRFSRFFKKIWRKGNFLRSSEVYSFLQ